MPLFLRPVLYRFLNVNHLSSLPQVPRLTELGAFVYQAPLLRIEKILFSLGLAVSIHILFRFATDMTQVTRLHSFRCQV